MSAVEFLILKLHSLSDWLEWVADRIGYRVGNH